MLRKLYYRFMLACAIGVIACFVFFGFMIAVADANSGVRSYGERYGEWRIQVATHVDHPVYPSLYDPAEAAHWDYSVSLERINRARYRVTVQTWDTRNLCGEFAIFDMRVIRYRDNRVRGGRVELYRLIGYSEWAEVPVYDYCGEC